MNFILTILQCRGVRTGRFGQAMATPFLVIANPTIKSCENLFTLCKVVATWLQAVLLMVSLSSQDGYCISFNNFS